LCESKFNIENGRGYPSSDTWEIKQHRVRRACIINTRNNLVNNNGGEITLENVDINAIMTDSANIIKNEADIAEFIDVDDPTEEDEQRNDLNDIDSFDDLVKKLIACKTADDKLPLKIYSDFKYEEEKVYDVEVKEDELGNWHIFIIDNNEIDICNFTVTFVEDTDPNKDIKTTSNIDETRICMGLSR
jgi:hypothetical protein